MAKIKSVALLQFNELGTEQKKDVLEKYRTFNAEGDWYSDNVLDPWEKTLAALGFENVKIGFNGFYSQGDGASFEASMNEEGVAKFMRGLALTRKFPLVYAAVRRYDEKGIAANIKIKHSGMYYHEYATDTMDMSEMQDNGFIAGELQKQWEDFISFIDDRVYGRTDKSKSNGDGWMIETNRAIYKDLKDWYEDVTSDEELTDFFETNDHYHFNAETLEMEDAE